MASPTSSSAFLPWIIQPQATRPFPTVVKPTATVPSPVKLPALFKVDTPSSTSCCYAAIPPHGHDSSPDEVATGSTNYRNEDVHLYVDDDASSITALRPIIPHASSPESQSLPSIQDLNIIDDANTITTSSPPLSCASSSSRSNSLSSWSPRSFDSSSSSRKGSIASLLNASESELRMDTPIRDELPISSNSSKRGRPIATNTKRKRSTAVDDDDEETTKSSNTRKPNCGGSVTKGLRHFSKLVSDKVAERGVTTYNEVADELAADIRASKKQRHGYDQKNIRRRVYDALNVLMAMDIIAKDKKEIRWLGIPACFHSASNEDDSSNDDSRRQLLEQQIKHEEERQAQLFESMQQMQRAVKNSLDTFLQTQSLVYRNQQDPTAATTQSIVEFPFHVVRCNQDYNVNVAHDGRQAIIESTIDQLVIDSHTDVLRSLGYGQMSVSQAQDLLPDPSWYSLINQTSSIAVSASS
ncbi:hypothetical protein K492DRAFT_178927 [Lichtheimia hyalospora FSU 10163]|nr:hypothetical protein K492DRAFT_178927 [Lichtheimia hyalospora FSU 10163]